MRRDVWRPGSRFVSSLLLLLVLMMLAPSALTAADQSKRLREVETLKGKCTKGKESACRKLAHIANTDLDPIVVHAAVEGLADQALLAEIATEHYDYQAKNIAVSKLSVTMKLRFLDSGRGVTMRRD